MSKRRQAPLRGQLRNDHATLLSQDWVSRHESLDALMLTRFRAYQALLDRLSPDEAKDGRCTSRKPDKGEVIVLKDKNVCKKKSVKMLVQMKLCRAFGFACQVCNKTKAKRSKQSKLCKVFGFRCKACRCGGH